MDGKKAADLIDAVKGMTDRNASMVEAFVSGLRAGKQLSDQGGGDAPAPPEGPSALQDG